MLEQFSRRLFGFDVFISFALTGVGRSTRAYAADLAQRLRSKDVTVYFSEDEMRGDELVPMLARALRQSRHLVVLANPGTLAEPRVVRKEVEEFRRSVPHGRVLPISLGGAFAPAGHDKAAVDLARSADEWLRFRDRVWITEPDDSSPLERCSDAVVEEIVKTLMGTRTNVKWRRLVAATLTILALLTAMSLWLAWRATTAEREAVAELQRAIAMRLVTEARWGLDGASGDRWTTSLRKLLIGRALGAVREADAILSQELQTHPPTLAHIWDVGTPIADFSLSADSKTIAIATDGTALRLAAEDEEARAFTLQAGNKDLRDAVRAVPCVDEKDCLIIATHNGKIHRVVGLSARRPSVAWTGDTGYIITSMVLSPDGGIAVTADGGFTFLSRNQLNAWDLKRREKLWGDGDSVTTLTVCQRSDLGILATGNTDGDIAIRRLDTGKILRTWRAGDDAYRVNALAFDPECKRLLSAYGYNLNDTNRPDKAEHPISVWDLGDPKAEPLELIGHQSFVMDIAVSPDGTLAASGARDGEVRLWNLTSGRGQQMPLASRQMSYGSEEVDRELPLAGHRAAVTRVRFDSLGSRLYSAGADGYLLAWSMQPPVKGSRPWAEDIAFEVRNAGNVLAVAAKTDMLLIGREDGILREYSLSTGDLRSDWPQPVSGGLQQIEVDPTEHWAVLTYSDKASLDLKYEVRDLSTRKPVGAGWQASDTQPYLAVFTSDGRRRMGCDRDSNVEVREMPEGNLLRREPLAKVAEPIEGLSTQFLVALCPSKENHSYDRRRQVLTSNLLAEPTYGDAARVRSLNRAEVNWQPIGKTAENDKVDLMAFSKDGEILVTASKGGDVRLWDTNTGGAVGIPMRFRSGSPVSIAITPDAARVAVLANGTVQVFLTPYHDGRSVCAWLPRPESSVEWKEWVGGRIARLPICK